MPPVPTPSPADSVKESRYQMTIPMTESQFQRQVTDLATRLGWEWLHVRPVGDSRGIWRTPTFGSLGKGWPDLVLIRRTTVIYAELKAQKGYLNDEQKRVQRILADVCPRVYVWRPADFDHILQVLTDA